MPSTAFQGLKVLALESRRAPELAKLIASYGGVPTVAPALREVPLESNSEAVAFVSALSKGEFDMVIFLTGVGTRALASVAENVYPREQFVAALNRVKVVARGPKPLAVLKELGVPASLAVPEPNTWREVLNLLDTGLGSPPLRGLRVAVQEYGISSPELLEGLEERGARVTRVPVYRWALPEDIGPLRAAVAAIAQGEFDVVLFTTSVQATHLLQVAAEMKLEEPLRRGLERMVIASIGPTTSEELRRRGLAADLEPSHPKMGFLVKETAERCAELLRHKRAPNVVR
jgi:uroporphyrinogen-III synthase